MTNVEPGGARHAPASELRIELMRMLAAGDAAWRAPEVFERWAYRAFAHQFVHNAPYGAYCRSRGVVPDEVRSWQDVPPVPVTAFQVLDLVCGPPDRAEAVFRTSGTTGGEGRRGRHHVRSVDLYRASLLPTFRPHVLEGLSRPVLVSLVPSPAELPDSSLSFMIGTVADELASLAHWVVDRSGRLDAERLARAAQEAERDGERVILVGTAFAFVHALDHGEGAIPGLPGGSRIMETGGFKGRAREVSRAALHGRLSDRTGVPPELIVNEYGMTELLSQLYEPVLSEGLAGAGWHVPPPWMRARALDPSTLEPVPEGERGLLAFFDLANLESVSHVLTEDVGTVVGGRVRLDGRFPGAEPRGCSRAMDELMRAAG